MPSSIASTRGARGRAVAPALAAVLLALLAAAPSAGAKAKKHKAKSKPTPAAPATSAPPDELAAPAAAAEAVAAPAPSPAPPPAASARPAPDPGLAPAPAPGTIRLAALILRAADAPIDPTLSDALTELLITSLAATGRYELVGKEEVKSLLAVDDEMRALECIVSPACLGALATHLRVAKALVGTVGRDAGGWLVSLTLVNLSTGETEQNLFVKIAGDQTALFEKLSAVAVEAATPRPAPGTLAVTANVADAEVLVDDASIGRAPARKAGLTAGVHRVRVVRPGWFEWSADVPVAAGTEVAVAAELKADPSWRESRPSFRVATGVTFALGLAGGGGAGVLSWLAVKNRRSAENLAAKGWNMAEAYARAGRAKDFALGANIAFGVAGAGLVTAALIAIFFRDDVFGRPKKSAGAAPKAAFRAAPLPGGAAASVEVAW